MYPLQHLRDLYNLFSYILFATLVIIKIRNLNFMPLQIHYTTPITLSLLYIEAKVRIQEGQEPQRNMELCEHMSYLPH